MKGGKGTYYRGEELGLDTKGKRSTVLGKGVTLGAFPLWRCTVGKLWEDTRYAGRTGTLVIKGVKLELRR